MTDGWIGRKIKLYMIEHGFTQVFVSRKTGIPTDKLNNSLNGKRRFTFFEYECICGVLGVNTDKFLSPKIPK